MNFESIINAVSVLAASGTENAAETVVSNSEVPSCATLMTSGGGWQVLLMYAAVIGLCYLLFIRPQNKRRKQEEDMRRSVEVGDEITTIGGICGRIVSIKDDETLVIETGSDRNKMKIKNWAISTNDSARERQAAEAPEQKKKGFWNK